MKKNVLIIGGSGFVGSTLVRSLKDDDWNVTLLNRGNRPMVGTTQLIADRNEALAVQKAAEGTERFDAVIDTSAYNQNHAKIAWDAFSQKTDHWIHLGSASVYKETPGRHPSETDEIGGAAVWAEYGVEKSEADIFLLNNAGQTPVTILRPPYLYGPGNDNDRETFVWSRALQGKSIVVPGNGQTPIQFLHVEDLAGAIKSALTHIPKKSAVYNVASADTITLQEWVATLSEIAGSDDRGVLAQSSSGSLKPRQYFPFRDYPCCVEVQKITQDLGWKAQYDVKEGFRQTFSTHNIDDLANRDLDTKNEDWILGNITQKKNSLNWEP